MANPSACLLLLNDLHVSKDNIPEFAANWREALDICRLRGIPQIALGGDLFLSRTAQTLDVLLAVRGALLEAAEAGVRITMAEGNHDLVDQEAILGYCHVFDQHPNVTVVDDFLTLADPAWDFVLHMMSYFPENGSFTSKLKALSVGSYKAGKLNYLYIHEGIRGALAQPSETELPAALFGDFDRVFVGHYHNRMVIKDTAIEYIGSSRQHNFGEDEAKGYTVLYTDGRHEFIQNKANIRYRVIDVQAEKVNVHLTDMLDENRGNDRCRIKVRIHGDEARLSSVDRKKLYEAGAAKVEFVAPDAETISAPEAGVLEKFDSRKIRESYEDFCSQKQVENPALGLSYLQKIEMPCGN
ncbi:metallophosphoesterase family protein [Alistipes timonensis]